VARRLGTPRLTGARAPGWPVWLLLVLVEVQIVAGAFVAGLDAGMAYNTWPLMDGAFIPQGLDVMDPFWKNLFENALTVQFNHRMIAYAITAWVAWLWWRQWRRGGFAGADVWVPVLAAMVAGQVVLGILTLINMVPIMLALLHQAVAFMLAGATMAYLADATPRRG
jgi:cytochrome c oxidase assembly protein subunit 15